MLGQSRVDPGVYHTFQVSRHQYDICCLDFYISISADRDTDICAGEGAGIVDAVASKSNRVRTKPQPPVRRIGSDTAEECAGST